MTTDDTTATTARHRTRRIAVFGTGLLITALAGLAAGAGIATQWSAPPPAPNAVDIGFSQDMTVHHRQAVDMANVVRDHSKDIEVRQLAFDIETGQIEQLGRMQGWLTIWGQPAQAPGAHMAWIPDASPEHGMHVRGPAESSASDVPMPGMATEDELARLRSLRDRELDVYFLQLMTRHHQGGIPMMRAGAQYAGTSQVRVLAAGMVFTQESDIAVMTDMLAQRGSVPLPPPL